ncbi:MAG: hypothetical protein AAF078_06150, partial [Planctomycetota bacterium]
MSEPRDIYELDDADERSREAALGDRTDPDALADKPTDELPDVELLSSTPVTPDPPIAKPDDDTFALADPSDTSAADTQGAATPPPEVAQSSDPAYDLAEPHPEDLPDHTADAGFTPGVAGGRPLPKGTLPTPP